MILGICRVDILLLLCELTLTLDLKNLHYLGNVFINEVLIKEMVSPPKKHHQFRHSRSSSV